jgi:DNA-binding transcriptional LysR family regulator
MHYDLIDLRLFLHVGELLNLTRAAEKSFLSVPSASLRIKQGNPGAHPPPGQQHGHEYLSGRRAFGLSQPNRDIDIELEEHPPREIIASVAKGAADLGIAAGSVRIQIPELQQLALL